MVTFQVNDMTCCQCVSIITKAVKAADKDAKVQIDLTFHRVDIEPVSADATELADAIKDAGYTPVTLRAAAAKPATTKQHFWLG